MGNFLNPSTALCIYFLGVSVSYLDVQAACEKSIVKTYTQTTTITLEKAVISKLKKKKKTRPKQETSHQQGHVNLSTLGSNFVFRTSIHGNSEEELHGSTATLRRFKQTAFVGKQKITVPNIGEKKTDVTPKTLQAEILYSP